MATFEVSDPFKVPLEHQRSGARRIDKAAIKEKMADDQLLGRLLESKGVYVFSLRMGSGSLPWYVGKSEKSTFFREAFNDRNILNLTKLINDRHGTLEASFITQSTSRGKPNLSQIGEIEYLLIGYAAKRNSHLLNVQNKIQNDDFTIKNVYNSGRGRSSKSELAFKKLMGL